MNPLVKTSVAEVPLFSEMSAIEQTFVAGQLGSTDIVDGTVLVWLCDENHEGEDVLVKGVLESEHPAVISWAESLYEEYLSESEPLDPAMLPRA